MMNWASFGFKCAQTDFKLGQDIMNIGANYAQSKAKQAQMTLTDYLIECSRNTDITVTDLSEVLEKLTPEILRAFIKRIDVYEKEVRYSRTCGNTIVIQYTFQLVKN